MPESDAKASGSPEDSRGTAGEEALTRSPTHQPHAFQEGEIAAGRFRITRFIGRGGMGEVYEAEDLELRERVALKTIRAEIASDRSAIERFKREIHLARRVTHTNVCRVFDIFHQRSDTPPGEVTFLTMELLSGETLAGRIRRQGRLSTAEARPLVEQMAAALVLSLIHI